MTEEKQWPPSDEVVRRDPSLSYITCKKCGNEKVVLWAAGGTDDATCEKCPWNTHYFNV